VKIVDKDVVELLIKILSAKISENFCYNKKILKASQDVLGIFAISLILSQFPPYFRLFMPLSQFPIFLGNFRPKLRVFAIGRKKGF